MSKTVRKIPTVKLNVEEAARVSQGRATVIDLMKAGVGFHARDTTFVTPGEKAVVKRLHRRKDRRTGRNEIRDLLVEAQEDAVILLKETEEMEQEWDEDQFSPIDWDDIYDDPYADLDDLYYENDYDAVDYDYFDSSWDW